MTLGKFLEEFKFLEITHSSGTEKGTTTTNFNDLNAASSNERYTFEVHYKEKPSEMFHFSKIKEIKSDLLSFKIMKIRVETARVPSGYDYSKFFFVIAE
jgi:hypothetical protein